MGNNKVKTQGQLQGKGAKGRTDLHPKSRKVLQSARVGLRTKRINEVKKERNRIEEDKIQRLLWFVKAMDENRARLSVAEMHEICEKFLARLDKDLEQERAVRRPGRPMSKHQEELEAAKTREAHEYAKEGLVLPDLTDESSVVSVRYWLHTLQGKPGYLTRLRLVRVFKDQNELAIEQEGASLGTKAKDAGHEVEETEMLE